MPLAENQLAMISTLVTSDFMTGIKAPGTLSSMISLPKKVSTVIGW